MSHTFNNEHNQSSSADNTQCLNHGGHEVLDMHETVGGIVAGLDQAILLRDKIQDPELLNILDRQYNFTLDAYNIIVESFKTGHDPSHPTGRYQMETGHNFTYGLTPGQPKKPMQGAQEITDDVISGFLLGAHKSNATSMTATALEITNPVTRRVVADSIANCIEMAYELAVYQNKRGYYQVPQLSQQNMHEMLNAFATSKNPMH
ncbi:MAG: spore coat protein [Lysinibacillus sp.]